MAALLWYVFKAAGNLIDAARGGQQPLDGQNPRGGHRGQPFGQPSQSQPSSRSEEGPAMRVVKKRGTQSQPSTPPDDVEDARFTDL